MYVEMWKYDEIWYEMWNIVWNMKFEGKIRNIVDNFFSDRPLAPHLRIIVWKEDALLQPVVRFNNC